MIGKRENSYRDDGREKREKIEKRYEREKRVRGKREKIFLKKRENHNENE